MRVTHAAKDKEDRPRACSTNERDRMTKLAWRSPESSNLSNFDQIAEMFGGIIAML